MTPRYLPAGESALVVEYGATAGRAFHDSVLALDTALAASPIDGVRESVPTYRSLMIHFDSRKISMADLIIRLKELSTSGETKTAFHHWKIPACYEPPYAEDLDELAGLLGMSPARIADFHASARYRVVMYGFAPGFVFLDGLPAELLVSRRRTPRPPAPPGSLTIANGQALIASVAMPTGWYVVGRTPARTFDLARDPPFPIGVGDEVTFERIDAETFQTLERAVQAGRELLAPCPA